MTKTNAAFLVHSFHGGPFVLGLLVAALRDSQQTNAYLRSDLAEHSGH